MESTPQVPRDAVPPGPLALARLTRGWRQADVALLAGCSRRYVGLIENGYVPAPHVREAIARALDVPVEAIWPATPTRSVSAASEVPAPEWDGGRDGDRRADLERGETAA